MNITQKAARELRHLLDTNATQPEQMLRLAADPTGNLALVLDRERRGGRRRGRKEHISILAFHQPLSEGSPLCTPVSKSGGGIRLQVSPGGQR